MLVPSLWLTAAVTYLATWSGWFASAIGWDRNYATAHGVRTPVISALYPLYEYHREMLACRSRTAACGPALCDYNSGHDDDNSSGGRQGPAVRGA